MSGICVFGEWVRADGLDCQVEVTVETERGRKYRLSEMPNGTDLISQSVGQLVSLSVGQLVSWSVSQLVS